MTALRLLLILCAVFTGACSGIGYYSQSLAGQLELWRKQQPVSQVLADPATDPLLKKKLIEIQSILDYAHSRLALPDNGSYKHYANLNRRYVVWNVFAAPEFSLQPKQWCYVVIGCTGYRGYFRQQQATDYAHTLAQAGWEVSVNGISAYSTLGWLRDPLLNTMLDRPNWEIARLLFHELAHQRIYIPGDTEFNEAFADAIADIGLYGWLREQHADQLAVVMAALEWEEQVYLLVFDARERFALLYQSGLAPAAMHEQKTRLHAQLQHDYLLLKQAQNGDNRYDYWIRNQINNAGLAALSTYRSLIPAFEAAWRIQGENLPQLYEWVKRLASCDRSERLAQLRQPAIEVSCRD